MRLDELVAWYQKKIGTYDKQQWEKTIEQKILAGITHLPLKNTKLKTELIDVDLVRGSTFPKAKSKLSILTVIYLAAVRLLFLPVYAKWWVRQTSPRVFILLLTLYLLQMINLGIYSYNVNKTGADQEDHIVSISDFLIPMALSFLLSVIHSQIVATASNTGGFCRQNKKCHSHSTLKKRERIRRKRRTRAATYPGGSGESTTTASKPSNDDDLDVPAKPSKQKLLNGTLPNNKSPTGSPARTAKKQGACSTSSSTSSDALSGQVTKDVLNVATKRDELRIKVVPAADLDEDESVFLDEGSLPPTPKVVVHHPTDASTDSRATNPPQPECSLRRRNVSWEAPVCRDNGSSSASNSSPPRSGEVDGPIDDDGFESLNGKSSGGEDSSNATVPSEKYYKKLPYTNTWLSGIPGKGAEVAAPEKDSRSDSDTDTLRNTPTAQQQDHLATAKPASIPPRRHLSSESGEDCSYSSDLHSDAQNEHSDDDYDLEDAPTIILNPSCGASDRVSCTIWDAREAKKAEMSVLDISSAIIERVEGMPETCDYVYIGVALSIILSLIPAFCRLLEATFDPDNSTELNFLDMPVLLLEKASFSCLAILRFAFGQSTWERTVLILGLILRLSLTYIVFFLLAVAERTFKQRFLYAKLFSHLTSSRRAQKSCIPHFRLNKVRNIKTWLCVRSYLKRRGPQNSVDGIVSAAFIITLLLLAFLSVEWLKDSVHLHSQFNLEALVWSCAFGTFLLRFMTLGTKINKKYKSVSVLITEQINLYVQIEQKPNKKEELMISNNVLKLAADLLKELESPFKISGLSANPYLYTTVKVVILSALSGVLSEMLGFKLKLHKIKIK
ncbi:protein phtf isoform X3 [Culex pipiens pallens]|uniref:protein phtf isoform X3 n=1 Tax=Culex pipiens pallens TaxID=42434 RepID=UPI0022AA268A|nr:protein phtf isoform X3 [Culex pipiens pallens]